MMKKSRNQIIDLIKGLGILLLVAAHAAVPAGSTISMFHMAIFFIASGYCIREAHSDTIGNAMKFIIKRTQRLYIPFVVWNVSLLCCKNIFIKINIYTNNPSFLEGIPGNAYGLTESLNAQTFFHSLVNILLFQGEQQLEGASWFLRAMFSASAFFILCDYLLKKISTKHIFLLRWIFAIVFLIIGNAIGNNHITLKLNFHSVFSIYFLFVVGMYFRNIGLLNDKKDVLFNILLLLSCSTILMSLNGMVSVNLSSSVFSSVPLFILVSILGWFFLWSLSTLITHVQYISTFFSFCGHHTMSILMMLFLSFKLVTLLQIYLYGYPPYALASFPCLLTTQPWCYIYTAVGLIVPLLVTWLWIKIKVKLFCKVKTTLN